MLLQTAIEVIY